MKIHPYIFAGIGRKYWITYNIHDGNAEINAFPGGRKSIPLLEATIEREKSFKALLGLGTIKITSVSGSVQEWTNVPSVDTVYDALVRASKGQSPEPTVDELRWEKEAPPRAVIFGEQVAFIPSVPGFFDTPLWKHYGGALSNPMGFGHSYVNNDQWVKQGDVVRSFGISKHDPECWTCRSEVRRALRLIDTEKHGWLSIPIHSPVSGLVLRYHDPFGAELGCLPESQNESGYADRFMYLVLLPKDAFVPETMGQAVEEFCSLSWQYRLSIFRNNSVLVTLGSTDEIEKERENPKVYSDERIDEVLKTFRRRKIIVRDLSSLPPEYREMIEKQKAKYPVNFR